MAAGEPKGIKIFAFTGHWLKTRAGVPCERNQAGQQQLLEALFFYSLIVLSSCLPIYFATTPPLRIIFCIFAVHPDFHVPTEVRMYTNV